MLARARGKQKQTITYGNPVDTDIRTSCFSVFCHHSFQISGIESRTQPEFQIFRKLGIVHHSLPQRIQLSS